VVMMTPAMESFVLHWGEMGTRWGINRTVAQIHALLYLSEKPLNAEEIAETLSVARSNVSNSLRELQSWGIVSIAHVLGDRRDHFESIKDVWQMFQIILDQRKKREIDPTLQKLRECQKLAQKQRPADKYTQERISEMLSFFETMTAWYDELRKLPSGAMFKLARMGGKLRRMLASA